MPEEATGTAPQPRAARRSKARGRGAGLALAAAGGVLIAWAGWQVFEARPAPFSIVPAEAAEKLLADVDLDLPDGAVPAGYEIRVEGVAEPVASFVALTQDGAVGDVLAWQNGTPAAVLSVDVDPAEVKAVAAAIREHAPPDAVLIGLGDSVGRLGLLAGLPSLVAARGVEPLIVPEVWRGRERAVASVADAFWAEPDVTGAMTTMDVAEALLSDEVTGSARLAAVAGDRPALLVLNLSDLIRLGALAPERFGVGYRDFPGGGDTHGLITTVKKWVREQGYDGYAVAPHGRDVVRVYFLLNAEAKGSLLAQALPFTTSNPVGLDVLSLVYQHGQTWIYRIKPLTATASDT